MHRQSLTGRRFHTDEFATRLVDNPGPADTPWKTKGSGQRRSTGGSLWSNASAPRLAHGAAQGPNAVPIVSKEHARCDFFGIHSPNKVSYGENKWAPRGPKFGFGTARRM